MIKCSKSGKLLYLALLGWGCFWILSLLNLSTGVRSLAQSAPSNLTPGWAYVDLVLGSAEKGASRSLSGGYNVGFNMPCSSSNCSHIEVVGNALINGFQWISGDAQTVSGGTGCLAGVNGGREPTGRHPYGSQFKVVLRNFNESTDTVDVYSYHRVCSPCGCTPYYIQGPKLATWRVGERVFIGL
jgi:hypothetical protein